MKPTTDIFRKKGKLARKVLMAILLSPILLAPLHSDAATLSIRSMNPETLELDLSEDPSSYFLVQQSTDLRSFFPYSMVLGITLNVWELYLDPDTPARFFRARAISIFAPEDSDGDGIDDIYEINHPVLNPLDPSDAGLDPGNDGKTYLQEYLERFGIGAPKREAVSNEVSVFTTRPFAGPAVEAISDEVSIFTSRPFTGPDVEAISEETSVKKIIPTP